VARTAIAINRGEDRKVEDRTAGLAAFSRQRKLDSRERLLSAAVERLCQDGYQSVSVEDIAAAAGVSRVTFYRHFSGKAELAVRLFRRASAAAMPRFVAIRAIDFRDRAAVHNWIVALFAADRVNRRLLRIFMQAVAVEPGFTAKAQELIAELIVELGEAIPAFALTPDRPAQRRRWLEAWLLLYEILDQSNHAALDSGVATDPLVMDILAGRFVAFVAAGDAT
jgi:AcrR family transcriptional regulator